jgi:hypothetical protein
MYLLQRELGVACAIPIGVAIGESHTYAIDYHVLSPVSVISGLSRCD